MNHPIVIDDHQLDDVDHDHHVDRWLSRHREAGAAHDGSRHPFTGRAAYATAASRTAAFRITEASRP